MGKDWENVAESFIGHKSSGEMYLHAKVGGKIIRRALGSSPGL
jgi:hypothetical protein